MLNNNFSKFIVKSTDNQIMDRFIPSTASQQIYRSRKDPNSVERLLKDPSMLNLNNMIDGEGASLLKSPDPEESEADVEHKDVIADALNFHHQSRVLTFTPTHSGTNSSPDTSFSDANSPSSISSINSPIFKLRDSSDLISHRSSMDTEISITASPKYKKKKSNIKSNSPYKILNAPALRNDFYCNLISWSKLTGKLAVGMGWQVCLWTEYDGYLLLDLPKDQKVSCVAFSDGMNLIVSSSDGSIRLFTQELESELDVYSTAGKNICSITWVPGSDSQFFVGDETGVVYYFEILNGIELRLVKKFICHQQQVCGIAVSNDLKEITVGGNDNSCTIWNIENILNPKLKFYLPHQAAVKAIAYCPWSNSLLATGGGSKDRTVRFWHTPTGTLLSSFKTSGQITSLIWSHTKRQIAITFGFGDTIKPVVISVLTYPDLKIISEVETEPGLRALSAVSSPDKSSICIASNDNTVRFYKFWDLNDAPILNYEEKGVYGSDIIELAEGIMKQGGPLR